MRLVVKGHVLDLKKGTKMSFAKSNPLFDFDDLKCERTQSFDIPSTPRNDAVFGIVNPAWNSDAMRRKFDAQLQDGLVVKGGYLYVDSYSNYTYKAVFVTGELVGLQRINGVGKLADVASDRLYEIGSEITYANVPDLGERMFEQVMYVRGKANLPDPSPYPLSPSVSVSALVNNISDNIGVQVDVPADVARWRIVPPKPNVMDGQQVRVSNRQLAPEYAPTTGADPTAFVNMIACNTPLIESAAINVINYEERWRGLEWERSTDWHYKIGVLHNLQALTLKFPDDFPANVFVLRIVNDDIKTDADVEFLGEYSFKKERPVNADTYDRLTGVCHGTMDGVTYEGEPLAGRSVDVPLNSWFLFVTPEDYVHTPGSIYRRKGWCWGLKSYDYSADVDGTNDWAQNGEFVRMSDNLPDMKFVELLKAVASVSGKVLNYTDEEGITFDDLDYNAWRRKVLDGSLMKVSEVKQVFGDYAQRNVITYTRDDNTMTESEVLSAVYIIDNDNLPEVDTLAEIKLANASEIAKSGEINAFINDQYDDAEQYFLLKGDTEEGRSHRWLKRLPITLNAGLQSLCSRSVSVKATFRMSLFEFESIKPKTVIVLRGVEYVWTKADWSDHQAQFELSAIG